MCNVLKDLVPVGNEGFAGFMAEGALTLDFQETINFTVGAGYTVFHERAIPNYRVPNNAYQCVFYPFTQNVTKKRGDTWHVTFSMYAEDFIPSMKCFLEYSWVVHRKDTVKLDNAENLIIFRDGLTVLSQLSEFRVGTGHFGCSYNITENIQASFGMQVVLHGEQVYKPYTFMGSVFMTF